ncbi:Helix-turn-helix domain-containing protein [Reichenbachiella agariperforans]|uniref:Helix-turn-helix domain-containing protein n=1 Tax=Reichenbachiella agariperforans TaxID=156994 RepID=A0A1M6PWT4_REIAG|nr:helix-turn-helix transcriptional regulator [Reichenbachiella agariperforans]SHK12444.1 Helix-turn-helix domain-containing protein [Reichenbachiella agariperforans]
MSDQKIFDTVKSYNDFNNHPTLHPSVSVLDFSDAEPRHGYNMSFGIFTIILKEVKCGDLAYGKNTYDYQEGTLVFIGPGQVVDVSNKTDIYQPVGRGLTFHPDILLGTPLAKQIDDCGFFSYNLSEALHLSTDEQQTVLELLSIVENELKRPIDKHSKKLITANISLFLDYCERFYDRQFVSRQHINTGVLAKFEELINGYFKSEKPYSEGLPSVGYFADQLHLSANYFGDLIKKETGKSAQEFIQKKLIEIAKDKIFDSEKSVKEIAFELGFKYPQHFNRIFKQKVGVTPKEFRDKQ